MTPKERLREEIKRHLREISAPETAPFREGKSSTEFLSQGERAAALLRSSPLWSRYETFFLFLSINSEIDTLPLREAALKEGKKVFAPKVEAEKLVFYPIISPDGPWRRGPFGIREPAVEALAGQSSPPGPAAGESAKDGDFPALILAPGLAFDKQGNRLGRGGGYYDRFFAELDKGGREYFALGLCMDFQVVDQVPAGENDKKMNGLLTGTQLYVRFHDIP